MRKPILFLLVILLIVLLYDLWFSPGGLRKTAQLKKQIAEQTTQNNELQERNSILVAEIKALKENTNAVEVRARKDLGMVKNGEVFYQFVK